MKRLVMRITCLGFLCANVPAAHGALLPATSAAASGSPHVFQERSLQPSSEPDITATFVEAPLRDVLFVFAEFAGVSIVPGADVSGIVSADIRNQPWDEALRVILESHGLAARELESGILRVDNIENLSRREDIEPLATRVFHLGYAAAAEILPAAQALLTVRGSASLGAATNSLIVMDVPRALHQVEALVEELDVRIPQVTISARIIFVNRTGLKELGVTYDLRDSRGEHLIFGGGPGDEPGAGGEAAEAPGGAGSDPDGGDVVLLDGHSISALGNAGVRISNPALSVLTSLIMGRHTLLAFLDVLETLNLSRMEAAPYISVLDNHTARILVGERTPIRVLDVGGTTGAGAPLVPTAAVDIQETGIVFEVTPHVTDEGDVLLDLHAERSFAEFTADASDAGVVFRTQEAASRVLVQDGETVVIGGLTVTERVESRSGIPLLMNIPVLGALFRVDRRQQVQRDLIILVTPYIGA